MSDFSLALALALAISPAADEIKNSEFKIQN